MSDEIDISTFNSVDIRTGKIVEASYFTGARKPAYKLLIDFGPLGMKKSSAQITDFYEPEQLIGKNVVAVVNLKPRQIANYISEVLVLGVPIEGGVVLLCPERDVSPGQRIS
ncbi:MAG: tRNA-binding protein [Thermoplasmata archaeon]|uniref:tRNA-binding protein n=1 Tax=Candidatus Sysuiplasma superficiale TaxID=2823368 RepID=A0A8J7YQ78_9ARCH|nr:tRNA-binding protein [Candidatus Sysuiplasma superficiale]MBX8643457.1 tRNA-binding protein [Candidatus Sysuiplasma superficiale]MCL4347235.1 tRNA-binding protein [Candidatus Thermoplasmatota archaeon]